MSYQVDTNRISFNELGIDNIAEKFGLLKRLEDVPTYNAGAYKGVTVNVNGSANKEKLLDVAEFGIKSVPYYRTQAINNPTYNKNIKGAPDVNYAREGTISAMTKANEILAELGLELLVLDAHRSPATQNVLFESFKEKYFEQMGCGLSQQTKFNEEEIKRQRLHLDEKAKEFALDFCSSAENFDSKDPKTWTIHSTGGAVDVVLLDKKSGRVVDMGEGYFDNPAEVTKVRHYEDKGNRTAEEDGYVKARRVLYNVMTSVGFVNYGNECFHFSYKDPYWGLVKGKEAEYGYVQSPKDRELAMMMSALAQSKGTRF